jgi:enamine deaminase RidA (YjgF/YER057c/UK114 family)
MSYEQNFLALGSKIPTVEPSVPPGLSFVLSRQVGNLLTLSGYGPFWGANVPPEYTGKLGDNITVAQGYAASQLTGINLLLMVRQAIGTLDNVVEIVEVNGMVNCTPDFTQHPDVINGCSELMVSIFGDAGKHTRAAVGMSSLAFAICVEISMSLVVDY